MLVSILVPIYKVEKYIEKCLDSIFHQTYPDIEYVFVDDCSPDKSLTILKRYIDKKHIDKSKVTIISHLENKGIATTRNDLLDNAKGKYVLFVDSDDWIETDMIEQMLTVAENCTIDIIGCDYIDNYPNGTIKYHYENYSQDCKENITRLINYNIGPAMWKILIKKELFNIIKFQPEIDIGEDYIASIKLYYYAHNCANVHKYLYHYVQYNNNRYSNQLVKSISDHIRAVTVVEDFVKSVGLYNDKIEYELKLRKFNIKHYYLFLPLLDFKKWKKNFPESDRMWRHIRYSKKEKIIYWLAEKHLFGLLQFVFCVERYFRKL